MAKYIWKINNQVWPNITPIEVKKGDRVQMTIINQTSMAHPMHLHGHVFEVVAVNGKAITDGPLRDTVFIPAKGSVTIEFDANNPGNWMFHCHVLYHAEDGMMTIVQYEGVANPEVLIDHKTS
jgi:FtsP/CotA-like multicopper oxidase with cupredoxin domain